tara:strand:- start:77 stop:427 length:351 start_codon:yes stop_codon:yes gene_type:complete
MSILDEHFRNPSNAGVLEDADLRVEVENPVCGDLLRLFIARDEEGLVREARFQAYGCPAAIGIGSLLTGLVAGKSRGEVRELGREKIEAMIGGLPDDKEHAIVLAVDALKQLDGNW